MSHVLPFGQTWTGGEQESFANQAVHAIAGGRRSVTAIVERNRFADFVICGAVFCVLVV